MLEHPPASDQEPEIDYSVFVTEDDEPVDNVYSERQQRLLGECLGSSWRPGRRYVALSNVGFFFGPREPLVPDFLLSMDVQLPEDVWEKRNRSYFMSVYKKPPDLVVEVVSNREGGEDGRKLGIYQGQHVRYYVIYDPEGHLGSRPLRLFEWHDGVYVESRDPFQPLSMGLSLTLWEGEYMGRQDVWLRWRDARGDLLLTGAEQARRAEEAQRRADRLEARLRELGEEVE